MKILAPFREASREVAFRSRFAPSVALRGMGAPFRQLARGFLRRAPLWRSGSEAQRAAADMQYDRSVWMCFSYWRDGVRLSNRRMGRAGARCRSNTRSFETRVHAGKVYPRRTAAASFDVINRTSFWSIYAYILTHVHAHARIASANVNCTLMARDLLQTVHRMMIKYHRGMNGLAEEDWVREIEKKIPNARLGTHSFSIS